VLSRLAGRLLTGPLAFFLAAVIDIGLFVVLAWTHRARKRLGSR
jgi:hypothetical protein